MSDEHVMTNYPVKQGQVHETSLGDGVNYF